MWLSPVLAMDISKRGGVHNHVGVVKVAVCSATSRSCAEETPSYPSVIFTPWPLQSCHPSIFRWSGQSIQQLLDFGNETILASGGPLRRLAHFLSLAATCRWPLSKHFSAATKHQMCSRECQHVVWVHMLVILQLKGKLILSKCIAEFTEGRWQPCRPSSAACKTVMYLLKINFPLSNSLSMSPYNIIILYNVFVQSHV